MRKYRLHIPAFDTTVSVINGKVTTNDPIINARGADWEAFRRYCEKLGWRIDPMLERPESIEYRGSVYEFHWHGQDLARITLHPSDEDPRDIRYSELPEVIREML